VAGLLDGDVEVTLRVPPPLETPFVVERDGDAVRVLEGETLVAEARSVLLDLEAPESVPFEGAAAASAAQPPDPEHPFPECFVCGTARAAGDGLALRPAPTGDGRVAAAWVPTAEQAGRRELVWAALDCPGAFAVDDRLDRGVSVLGRMHAGVRGVPRAGEQCVVVGWSIGAEGRRRYAGTALFGDGSRLLGLARATWFLLR
jgi:hypothetical protein